MQFSFRRYLKSPVLITMPPNVLTLPSLKLMTQEVQVFLLRYPSGVAGQAKTSVFDATALYHAPVNPTPAGLSSMLTALYQAGSSVSSL